MRRGLYISPFIILLTLFLSACGTMQGGGWRSMGSDIGNYHRPEQVALLLPLSGHLARAGKAIQSGFMTAYYDDNSPIKVRVYNTGSALPIVSIYQQAISEGADLVVGPLAKTQVQALEQQGRFPVTTIALNYTPGTPKTRFVEFGLSPEDESEQAAEKAFEDGYRSALIIAPSDQRGQMMANAFFQRWTSLGGETMDSYFYSRGDNITQGIANLLQVNHAGEKKGAKKQFEGIDTSTLRRQDSDMIFLAALPQMAHQIMPMLRYYFAGDIPTYSTSMVYSGTHSTVSDRDLNGLYFCDTPWTLGNGSTKQSMPRLYALGMDAYLLANNLIQLTENGDGLRGQTGRLYITEQNHIRRILPWAKFRNGQPQIIATA